MAELKSLWVEKDGDSPVAIRIDWDNERHQRIPVYGLSPEFVIVTLRRAVDEVERDLRSGNI